MCGIAGLLGRADGPTLKAMADAITHRGPDGWGMWQDEELQIGLAHRRLAILDLSDAAAQPMAAVEGRYRVTFNGEIYNFKELGADLRARGYQFNPHSDTAILGPLFDAFGEAMVQRLNGIFAFAIWDNRERRLFLARDPIGAKPLYYTRQAGRLAFASELKALARLPGIDRTLDEAAILDYLEKLWSPGERTPLRAVRKLPPGHMMIATHSAITITPYACAVGAEPSIPRDAAAAQGRLQSLLNQSIADQCVSDVPVGAFLSGGVDSTAIVAAMVKTGNRPAQTYCIGFDGPGMEQEGFSEDLTYAKIAAEALSVPLKSLMMKMPDADDFARLAIMLDEPQADPAPLYVDAICTQASADGVKVLLSGAGGDDIFSGYRRHIAASIRDHFGVLGRLLAFAPALSQTSAYGRRLARMKDLMGGDNTAFLARSFAFNAPDLALSCLSPALRGPAALAGADAHWGAALRAHPDQSLSARVLRLERFGFLPDHNLNYTDKASMAHGIEVRVPLLDPRLVAFADALPHHWKVNGFEPKWLLKQTLRNCVPRAIVTRKKTGFGGPVRHWINGPLAPALRDVLASTSFKNRGVFDPAGVERVRAATASGTADGAYLLLAVMMIEFWLREFVDGGRASGGGCRHWYEN